MAVNRGKQFEEKIKQAFLDKDNVFILRLIDPQNGYAGVRNICDFIAFKEPVLYLLECKSCHGNTLPFTNITDNQWQGLYECSSVSGICSGYLIWFIDKDITVFIDAQEAYRLREAGAKSINVNQLKNIQHLNIPGKKNRILFDYDVTEFLKITGDYYGSKF